MREDRKLPFGNIILPILYPASIGDAMLIKS